MLALLLTLVAAQDVTFKDLAIGDRVEVRFHSGNVISGMIVAPPGKPKGDAVDVASQASLTLDVSSEYPGLTGTMTIAKKEIQKVRKLPKLSPEDEKRLAEMKKKLAEEAAKPPPPKPAPPLETPPAEKPKADEPKVDEDLKKGQALFVKFPPPDWSADRLKAIQVKRASRVIPSLDEQEFEKGFPLWDKARAAAEKSKKD